jgi:hypothetical protein
LHFEILFKAHLAPAPPVVRQRKTTFRGLKLHPHPRKFVDHVEKKLGEAHARMKMKN